MDEEEQETDEVDGKYLNIYILMKKNLERTDDGGSPNNIRLTTSSKKGTKSLATTPTPANGIRRRRSSKDSLSSFLRNDRKSTVFFFII